MAFLSITRAAFVLVPHPSLAPRAGLVTTAPLRVTRPVTFLRYPHVFRIGTNSQRHKPPKQDDRFAKGAITKTAGGMIASPPILIAELGLRRTKKLYSVDSFMDLT